MIHNYVADIAEGKKKKKTEKEGWREGLGERELVNKFQLSVNCTGSPQDKGGKRERGRTRERERETERQTDRQTERYRDLFNSTRPLSGRA